MNLRSNKKFAFYNQGILSLDEVSKHRDQLNDRQVRQIEAELTQETLIDKDNIRAFIDDLTYLSIISILKPSIQAFRSMMAVDPVKSTGLSIFSA